MAETLNLQIPSPTFEGSTGGWLRAAEVEEKYAITWTSKKEQVFAGKIFWPPPPPSCPTHRLWFRESFPRQNITKPRNRKMR